ncbi:chloride channel protein [Novosphingobium mangrovi (ex Huang et al. 2023)]|uniref:Chloride channel protein n=1 Tax=Novosphingobium mangrovi (ex Huang et al. 2023) TaxID=2976432 RepID=A0ABT2I852_9SPHN|nr:chloride channel protein [Novosphingobium mangrovi (ex Huang et al. 2023)]MCT2400997.1 chloride channel protein [Novosphingobium mangrovi (ex Huang et al. 2023)]
MTSQERIKALFEAVPGLDDSMDAARRRAATAIGAISLGLIAIIFAWLGDKAQQIFNQFQSQNPYAPLVLTPAVFVAVVWITNRWTSDARGSGIPQVMAAGKDLDLAYTKLLSMPTALAKLLLTVAMLLAGGSVGREGPTVQVAAAVMVTCHRLFRVPMTAGVLIAGGAAGVAAAFNTPLAGVAFAIEELAAAFEQRVAVLVMGAVVVSGLVSLGLSGDYVYFGIMHETLKVSSVVLIAPVAGVVGGALGGLFSRTLLAFARSGHSWFVMVRKRPVLVAFVCGLLVAVLGLVTGGSTWGTGYEVTKLMVEGHQSASPWFGPAKFLATAATAVSGAPGGIFAPSLSVGAGVGQLLAFCFPDDPMPAIVLLGMTGYFVGVVRAPLTAVIILMETTASRGMILPLFATAIIADAVSKLVCREKLYHGLSRSFSSHGEAKAKQA